MSRRVCGEPADSRVPAKLAASDAIRGPWPAGTTRIGGAAGSTSRLNGTPSASPSAQSVSTLGLPVADSSWERVDLAIPARRASSVSVRPARSRSRRIEDAITASSGAGTGSGMFATPVLSFDLTNSTFVSIVENMQTVRRSLARDVAAIAAAVLFVGVSYGAIARADGVPVWAIVAMSVLVFAGGSQFLAVGLLAAGNPVAAVAGGLLLNARHLPFGLSTGDLWDTDAPGGGRRPRPARRR